MKPLLLLCFSFLMITSYGQHSIYFRNETNRPLWIQKRTLPEKGSFPHVIDSMPGKLQQLPVASGEPVMLNVLVIPQKGAYGTADGIYYLFKPNDTLLVQLDKNNKLVITHLTSALRTKELSFVSMLTNNIGMPQPYSLLKTDPRLYKILMSRDLVARDKLIDSLSRSYINTAKTFSAKENTDPQVAELYRMHFFGMMVYYKLFAGYEIEPAFRKNINDFYADSLSSWSAVMDCNTCRNIPFYNLALSEVYQRLFSQAEETALLEKISSLSNEHNKNFLLSDYTIHQLERSKNKELLMRTYEHLCTDSLYRQAVNEKYLQQKNNTQLGDEELGILLSKNGSQTGFTRLISGLKGKTVYVDFWASWCKPCIEEIPYSHLLREKIKDSNIVMLYLSIDTDVNNWKQAAKKHLPAEKNSYILLDAEESKLAKKIQLGPIPRYMIIDKKGKIIQPDAGRPSDASTYDILLDISKQ